MTDNVNALREHLAGFVQAARESETGYTVRDLQEMVELELLGETGGFINWLKRKVTGIDDDALAEIQDGLNSIKTEEDRQKTLRDIDELLKECEAIAGRSTARNVATGLGGVAVLKLSGLGGDQGLVGKAVVGTARAAGAVVGRLVGAVFGAIVPGLKGGGAHGAMILGKAGAASVAAYGFLKLTQGIARIQVAKDGTMDDYIAALRAARKEVESKKLG